MSNKKGDAATAFEASSIKAVIVRGPRGQLTGTSLLDFTQERPPQQLASGIVRGPSKRVMHS